MQKINLKLLLILSGLTLVAATALSSAAWAAPAKNSSTSTALSSKRQNNPFCGKLGKSVQASQAAQMFCNPPQSSTAPAAAAPSTTSPFGTNVDAANPQEDISPAGVSAHGQSEESIAAAGQYVVEAWNDATGFVSACGAPVNKEELTGFGFSTDGGKTFRDLGGLPNNNCQSSVYAGDPSVEALTVGGSTYFYISSIFIPFNVPENAMAVTACQVIGSGSSANLDCGQPTVAAISSDCQVFYFFTFCSFLDKDFLALDPGRSRLYLSYTEFGPSTGFSGVVELSMCDLSNPMHPRCQNGGSGSITGPGAMAPPYFVVAPADQNFCENEGAYPAVDPATGDVYVAYEHDWFSSLFNCGNETIQNVMNYVPASCLTATPTSFCGGPAATSAVNIVSMEGAFIPGYNRFPMNDFPRLAVSSASGTVSMVWNDARQHPTGDIFLQSFNLGTLSTVQSAPVRVNGSKSTGGWQFLPAVRNASGRGLLDISYYSRDIANTALTNVHAALGIDPRIVSSPKGSDAVITTGPTDWNAVSSLIIPNFGDYTDNYVAGGSRLYVAWADGRLGIPQPFEDSVAVR
jgi:hypothetical protein